jgi:MYXO-CTERM domain-containing protein
LDQPGDSIYFVHGLDAFGDGIFAGFNITGIAAAAFRGFPGSSKYSGGVSASKLSFGESIATGHFTQAGFVQWASIVAGILAFSTYGQWKSPGMGFVGFAFNNGAGPQFGWARVRISTWFPGGYAFKVLDFAYGDPGERITAGQRTSNGGEDDQDISDEQAPDEGSLGGLALGALGLLAWRRSRSLTAS